MTLSIFSLCRLMLLSSITAEYIKLGIVDTLLLSRFSIHFILLYSKYFADFFFRASRKYCPEMTKYSPIGCGHVSKHGLI